MTDLADVTRWGGLGLIGYGLFWLLKDNIRLRREAKENRGAEARAVKAEAQVAGLTVRVGDLTEEVARLRTRLEEFIQGEGAGHA